MTTYHSLRLVLAATLLAGAACARTIPVDGTTPADSAAQADEDVRRNAPAEIIVRNQSTFQLAIFAARGGQRVRLGTARPLSDTRMRVPDDLLAGGENRLQLVADPIGGRAVPFQEQVLVRRGTAAVVTIRGL